MTLYPLKTSSLFAFIVWIWYKEAQILCHWLRFKFLFTYSFTNASLDDKASWTRLVTSMIIAVLHRNGCVEEESRKRQVFMQKWASSLKKTCIEVLAYFFLSDNTVFSACSSYSCSDMKCVYVLYVCTCTHPQPETCWASDTLFPGITTAVIAPLCANRMVHRAVMWMGFSTHQQLC